MKGMLKGCNMQNLDIKDIQEVSLDILKRVDSFCKSNGIRYFLDSGTLLGAARSKGFIPWDDDIDLVMPRPDYSKFEKEFIDSAEYKLFAPSKGNCLLPYARVCDINRTYSKSRAMWTKEKPGVGIDIFPLDGAPDTVEEFDELSDEFVLLRNDLWRLRYAITPRPLTICHPIEVLKEVAHACRRRILGASINRDIEITLCSLLKLQARYDYTQSSMCYYIGVNSGRRKYWRKEWFEEELKLEFCGGVYPAPKGYDERLTAEYGDWQMPPPDSCKQDHVNIQTVYWR